MTAFLICAVIYTNSVCGSVHHGVIALHNGYLADTHEIAAANSALLATNSKISHGYFGHGRRFGYHGGYSYHGPIAIPHVLHNGDIADTHEVAAGKSSSISKLSLGYSAYYGHGGSNENRVDYRYHGPIAIPHVLHDGHIADTHEKTTAKAGHFTASAKAKAYGGYNNHYGQGGSYGAHGDYRYHGPIAIPYVLHDGHIADTHEVAAAKAEHLAAVANAKAHGGYHSHGDDHSSRYASGYDTLSGDHGAYHGSVGYEASYHGPIAKPVVLPSGFLADSHDVAVAKAKHLTAYNNAKAFSKYNNSAEEGNNNTKEETYTYQDQGSLDSKDHSEGSADSGKDGKARSHKKINNSRVLGGAQLSTQSNQPSTKIQDKPLFKPIVDKLDVSTVKSHKKHNVSLFTYINV